MRRWPLAIAPVLLLTLAGCDRLLPFPGQRDHGVAADRLPSDQPLVPPGEGGRQEARAGDAARLDGVRLIDAGSIDRAVSVVDARGDLLLTASDLGICASLMASYAKIVAQLKSCCSLCPIVQCDTLINDALLCPCPTYANAPDASTQAQITSLKNQWAANSCGKGVMCPTGCIAPFSGNCTLGSCADNVI
jgi:hypothetical protein